MQIEDTRHKTPDDYSVEAVYVGYDWSNHDPKHLARRITLKLKPEPYFRSRFAEGGESYESKKHARGA
jgi:hypothetical protein